MLLYFENVRFAFMRNGLSKNILHKTYSVLTYDNSQVSLAKLMSLLLNFYPLVFALCAD